jgi:hypothetical protein
MRPHRTTSLSLALVLLAAFLLPCFDFCPEEKGNENCPPVCASCLGCPRASVVTPSVVVSMVATDTVSAAPRDLASASLPILADDIPHIPLAAA